MHGQFDTTFHFTPADSNLLIVSGPLIADTPEELAQVVRVGRPVVEGVRLRVVPRSHRLGLLLSHLREPKHAHGPP